MSYLNRNTNKTLVGLGVIMIALISSAFVTARDSYDFYAQISPDRYILVDANSGVCMTPSHQPCGYSITPEGLAAGIQNSGPYTWIEMNAFLNLPTPYVSILPGVQMRLFVPN